MDKLYSVVLPLSSSFEELRDYKDFGSWEFEIFSGTYEECYLKKYECWLNSLKAIAERNMKEKDENGIVIICNTDDQGRWSDRFYACNTNYGWYDEPDLNPINHYFDDDEDGGNISFEIEKIFTGLTNACKDDSIIIEHDKTSVIVIFPKEMLLELRKLREVDECDEEV